MAPVTLSTLKNNWQSFLFTPPASTSSNWAEMASAECPNHISPEWKVAEIPLHFPVINESDVWHCAEAVCARGLLSDTHAGVRRVSGHECEESGRNRALSVTLCHNPASQTGMNESSRAWFEKHNWLWGHIRMCASLNLKFNHVVEVHHRPL